MRTALPAGFEACPPLWACPDVEEGLKGTLGCLVLGQLLAANIRPSTRTAITKLRSRRPSARSERQAYRRPGRSSLSNATGLLGASGSGTIPPSLCWACTIRSKVWRSNRPCLSSSLDNNSLSAAEVQSERPSEHDEVSNSLKSVSGKSAWSEVKSAEGLEMFPMARWAWGALGNWTKDLRASSAALILAFFFVGPVPSKVSPFTSTAMEKTGAWTGPVCDTMRYCKPGRSSLSCTKAFFGASDQDSFL